MTIPNMAFTPTDGLRNKSTYPTDPVTEDALRDAVQEGMDQLRDYINNNVAPKMFDKNGDTLTGKLATTGGAGTESDFSSAAPSVQLLSGYASPISGRLIIGNGTGWKFAFSKRAGGVTTDIATILDTGSIQIGNNNVAQVSSGGTKIQSGTIAAGVTGAFTVTFPNAFAATPVVIATYHVNGGGTTYAVAVQSSTATLATFVLGSAASGGSIQWMAIGT